MIMRFAIMVIIAIVLVVGSTANGFHDDIPYCEDGNFGWYLISGNDEIGYAVFLAKEPLKFSRDPKDPQKFVPQNEPEIICTIRPNAIIYVFGPPKKA